MSVAVYALLTWCLWTFVGMVEGTKGGAIYHHLPACHRIGQQFSIISPFYRCNNPLYTLCYQQDYRHICCGPNHYCCFLPSGFASCCRKESWNGYEISAVVTGGLAWIGILIVLLTCLGPTVVRQISRKLRIFRKPKVHPKMELRATHGHVVKK